MTEKTRVVRARRGREVTRQARMQPIQSVKAQEGNSNQIERPLPDEIAYTVVAVDCERSEPNRSTTQTQTTSPYHTLVNLCGVSSNFYLVFSTQHVPQPHKLSR